MFTIFADLADKNYSISDQTISWAFLAAVVFIFLFIGLSIATTCRYLGVFSGISLYLTFCGLYNLLLGVGALDASALSASNEFVRGLIFGLNTISIPMLMYHKAIVLMLNQGLSLKEDSFINSYYFLVLPHAIVFLIAATIGSLMNNGKRKKDHVAYGKKKKY